MTACSFSLLVLGCRELQICALVPILFCSVVMYDEFMKMFYVFGVLFVGTALAFEPLNHETLSPVPLWKYEVYGKVKSITTCDGDGKKCAVQEFNPYGVPTERLVNRKPISNDGQVTTLESVRPENAVNPGRRVETYFGGQIIKIENLKLNGDLIYRVKYQYNQKNELISIKNYEIEGEEEYLERSEDVSYKNGKLYQVIVEDEVFKTIIIYNKYGFAEKEMVYSNDGFDSAALMQTVYSYQYDKQGNWIKKSVDGKLKNIRRISYY